MMKIVFGCPDYCNDETLHRFTGSFHNPFQGPSVIGECGAARKIEAPPALPLTDRK